MAIIGPALGNEMDWLFLQEPMRRMFGELSNRWLQPEPPQYAPAPSPEDAYAESYTNKMAELTHNARYPQDPLNISRQGVEDYVTLGGTLPELRKLRTQQTYDQYQPLPQFNSNPEFYGKRPGGSWPKYGAPTEQDKIERQKRMSDLSRNLTAIHQDIQAREYARRNQPLYQQNAPTIPLNPINTTERQMPIPQMSPKDMLEMEEQRSRIWANQALAQQRLQSPDQEYELKQNEKGEYVYVPKTPGTPPVSSGVKAYQTPTKKNMRLVETEKGMEWIEQPEEPGPAGFQKPEDEKTVRSEKWNTSLQNFEKAYANAKTPEEKDSLAENYRGFVIRSYPEYAGEFEKYMPRTKAPKFTPEYSKAFRETQRQIELIPMTTEDEKSANVGKIRKIINDLVAQFPENQTHILNSFKMYIPTGPLIAF